MTDAIEQLREQIVTHLDEISALFKPGARITIVITNDDYGDAGVVISNDDLDRAIREIYRQKPQHVVEGQRVFDRASAQRMFQGAAADPMTIGQRLARAAANLTKEELARQIDQAITEARQ